MVEDLKERERARERESERAREQERERESMRGREIEKIFCPFIVRSLKGRL